MCQMHWFVCFITLGLTLPATVSAQVTTADIVGRVTDSSGGVLPGATVTIENVGTRDIRVVPTNSSGDYLVTLLPIGTYTVKIELQGFGTQTRASRWRPATAPAST